MESFVTVGAKNLTSIILPDISTTTFANILTTTHGPYAMRQIMGFNNQTVVDKVPPEMLHLIDPHWYQFPPMDSIWHKILGLVMIVLGLMGWIGNSVVVYVFLMTSSLRTPSNFLVVNLVFSDFIMMMFMPSTVINCYYETKDWSSKSYILVYSIFVYYTPLLTIIYSYYFIFSAVAGHEKSMREQTKKMNVQSLRSGDNQNISAEAKLAKMALMTISLWFLAWTPYLIINYTGIFGDASISPLCTIWESLFAKANAIYNPIVYGISHPKYRAALREKLPFCVCGSIEDSSTTAKTAETTSTVTTA